MNFLGINICIYDPILGDMARLRQLPRIQPNLFPNITTTLAAMFKVLAHTAPQTLVLLTTS